MKFRINFTPEGNVSIVLAAVSILYFAALLHIGQCQRMGRINLETGSVGNEFANEARDNRQRCINKHALCTFWSQHGQCSNNTDFMQKWCPGSCNILCANTAVFDDRGVKCKDYHKLCRFWRKSGECSRNFHYMLWQCPKSCSPSCAAQADKDELLASSTQHPWFESNGKASAFGIQTSQKTTTTEAPVDTTPGETAAGESTSPGVVTDPTEPADNVGVIFSTTTQWFETTISDTTTATMPTEIPEVPAAEISDQEHQNMDITVADTTTVTATVATEPSEGPAVEISSPEQQNMDVTVADTTTVTATSTVPTKVPEVPAVEIFDPVRQNVAVPAAGATIVTATVPTEVPEIPAAETSDQDQQTVSATLSENTAWSETAATDPVTATVGTELPEAVLAETFSSEHQLRTPKPKTKLLRVFHVLPDEKAYGTLATTESPIGTVAPVIESTIAELAEDSATAEQEIAFTVAQTTETSTEATSTETTTFTSPTRSTRITSATKKPKLHRAQAVASTKSPRTTKAKTVVSEEQELSAATSTLATVNSAPTVPPVHKKVKNKKTGTTFSTVSLSATTEPVRTSVPVLSTPEASEEVLETRTLEIKLLRKFKLLSDKKVDVFETTTYAPTFGANELHPGGPDSSLSSITYQPEVVIEHGAPIAAIQTTESVPEVPTTEDVFTVAVPAATTEATTPSSTIQLRLSHKPRTTYKSTTTRMPLSSPVFAESAETISPEEPTFSSTFSSGISDFATGASSVATQAPAIVSGRKGKSGKKKAKIVSTTIPVISTETVPQRSSQEKVTTTEATRPMPEHKLGNTLLKKFKVLPDDEPDLVQLTTGGEVSSEDTAATTDATSTGATAEPVATTQIVIFPAATLSVLAVGKDIEEIVTTWEPISESTDAGKPDFSTTVSAIVAGTTYESTDPHGKFTEKEPDAKQQKLLARAPAATEAGRLDVTPKSLDPVKKQLLAVGEMVRHVSAGATLSTTTTSPWIPQDLFGLNIQGQTTSPWTPQDLFGSNIQGQTAHPLADTSTDSFTTAEGTVTNTNTDSVPQFDADDATRSTRPHTAEEITIHSSAKAAELSTSTAGTIEPDYVSTTETPVSTVEGSAETTAHPDSPGYTGYRSSSRSLKKYKLLLPKGGISVAPPNLEIKITLMAATLPPDSKRAKFLISTTERANILAGTVHSSTQFATSIIPVSTQTAAASSTSSSAAQATNASPLAGSLTTLNPIRALFWPIEDLLKENAAKVIPKEKSQAWRRLEVRAKTLRINV